MNFKPVLLNISFIIYLIGMLITIGVGIQEGAIIILIASVFIITTYIIQIIQSFRKKRLWSFENLIYTSAVLVLAVIFMHGFSISIGMPLLGSMPTFSSIYLASGILLILLFLGSSLRTLGKVKAEKNRFFLQIILIIAFVAFFLGILGVAGILPFSGWLITYSLIGLGVCYLLFSAIKFFSKPNENRSESAALMILSGLVITFIIVRFLLPLSLPKGLTNSIITFGFLPVLLLPLSLLYLKKYQFFTLYIVFFITLDFYFIHVDRNFNYMVTVGIDGCEGYDNATNYPINTDPGISLDDLFIEPTIVEIEDISGEWRDKDFSPHDVKVEHIEVRPNGDSLKLISHKVNGIKHYGLIRIPKGIEISRAPILLGLMGGGTGIDVLKTTDINRLSAGICRDILDNYISIMPSFRGNIVRGEGFCFRSEGYAGDVWLGPAEDAIAFLEAVKSMYNKAESTKTLVAGVSRGATVALIIGGLTDKVDYIIANSTHTKFLDHHVVLNEKVGRSYSRAFYTPKADPKAIRKRIIASSPYYFSKNLPAFELHQGANDHKTTVWHANMLKNRIGENGSQQGKDKIYIYEDQGHGYDDDQVVCESLIRFLED